MQVLATDSTQALEQDAALNAIEDRVPDTFCSTISFIFQSPRTGSSLATTIGAGAIAVLLATEPNLVMAGRAAEGDAAIRNLAARGRAAAADLVAAAWGNRPRSADR